MKTNNKKWLFGSMLGIAIAAGFTSCSDDHFDINPDVLGRETIWKNIQNNDQLSEYADILKSVNYSITEEKTTPETYADIFNSDQTFTVWAPTNGTFNYAYYKNLISSGVRDSIYKVENELIRNSMTRYSHVINGADSLKLDLFNSKSVWLNYDNNTFHGQQMTQTNIGAKNGILHIISGSAKYTPNLYEFLASRQDLDSVNAFVKAFQTNEFDEYKSTKGPTVNGKATWVDSITYVSNKYTSRQLYAHINREDSNYVMIIPTNKAWRSTLEKTKNYFHFKATYEQDVNTQTETGVDTIIKGAKTEFTQHELDSITDFYSKNAMLEKSVFNANWQFMQIPVTSIDDIRKADARNDSLLTTNYFKFKRTGTLNETNREDVIEVPSFAAMFGNANPIETSNGYAYVVDEFTFPTSVYAPDIDLLGADAYESADNQCKVQSTTKTINGYSLAINENDTMRTNSVFKYDYLIMGNKTATAHPGAFFKAMDVLSCKYDIYVVIGYNTDYNLQNKFRAYISYDTEEGRETNVILKNPNEDALDAKGESIFGSNYFVNCTPSLNSKGEIEFLDTICVAKDFMFPVSYKGLTNAYPTIQLKSSFTSKENSYYCREVWVNAIILREKGHDEEPDEMVVIK